MNDEKNNNMNGSENGNSSQDSGKIIYLPEYMQILYGDKASQKMPKQEEKQPEQTAQAPEKRFLKTKTKPQEKPQEKPQPEQKTRPQEKLFEVQSSKTAEEPKKKAQAPLFQRNEDTFENEVHEKEYSEDYTKPRTDRYGRKRPVKNKKPKFITDREKKRQEKRELKKIEKNIKFENKINTPVKPEDNSKKARLKVRIVEIAVIAFLVISVVAVSIISSIRAKNSTTYHIAYITSGDLTGKGTCDMYFVRKGYTIEAPGAGVFVAKVADGERVGAGTVIGYITKSEYVSELRQLQEVEALLLSMQNENSGGINSDALSEADEMIREYKNRLSDSISNGNLSEISEIKILLETAIEYRNELILNSDSDVSTVKTLKARRTELQNKLSGSMTKVVADTAGTVSFMISGHESEENALYDEIASGNYDTFEKKSEIYKSTPKSTDGIMAEAGSVVAKVITNTDYYMLLASDSNYNGLLSKTITVTSDNGAYTTKGTCLSFSTLGDKYAIVVRTSRAMRSCFGQTGNSASFAISKTSGYRVPVSALTDWDTPKITARLSLVRAGMVKFVYVTVVDTDGEYAIIKNNGFSSSDSYIGDPEEDNELESESTFKANDAYIVNSENVKEGQVIT